MAERFTTGNMQISPPFQENLLGYIKGCLHTSPDQGRWKQTPEGLTPQSISVSFPVQVTEGGGEQQSEWQGMNKEFCIKKGFVCHQLFLTSNLVYKSNVDL